MPQPATPTRQPQRVVTRVRLFLWRTCVCATAPVTKMVTENKAASACTGCTGSLLEEGSGGAVLPRQLCLHSLCCVQTFSNSYLKFSSGTQQVFRMTS